LPDGETKATQQGFPLCLLSAFIPSNTEHSKDKKKKKRPACSVVITIPKGDSCIVISLRKR